jgi:hypothetical protein
LREAFSKNALKTCCVPFTYFQAVGLLHRESAAHSQSPVSNLPHEKYDEYGRIEETFAASALELIADWNSRHCLIEAANRSR